MITKSEKIKTQVCLYPMMINCTGTCAACRVRVAGKTVLACTDGPVFDGHRVDFDDFAIRLKMLRGQLLCDSHPVNPRRNGSATLTKFLKGILKR